MLPKLTIFLLVAPAFAQDAVTCGQLKSVYQSGNCCSGVPSTSVDSSCPLFSSMQMEYRFANAISAGEIMMKTANDYVQLIDVRSPSDYATGTFKHAVNCPLVADAMYTPSSAFLGCVHNNTIANIPTVFACDSGNRATYALTMAQNAGILLSSGFALKPGGIAQISGYPIDSHHPMMGGGAILFNNYVSTTTAIGMMASQYTLGVGFSSEIAFVDVRSSMEFGWGNVTGSFNAPLLIDPMNTSSVNPTFATDTLTFISGVPATAIVLVYCASGNRATQALDALYAADATVATRKIFAVQNGGFTQIYDPEVYTKGALMQHAIYNSLIGLQAANIDAAVSSMKTVYGESLAAATAQVMAMFG